MLFLSSKLVKKNHLIRYLIHKRNRLDCNLGMATHCRRGQLTTNSKFNAMYEKKKNTVALGVGDKGGCEVALMVSGR